jgi:hypothetical protein
MIMKTIYYLLFLVCFFVVCSCTPSQPEQFSEVVSLKKIEIHIVSDKEQFEWKDSHRDCVGYATPNGEIWILGTKKNGKVYFDQSVLGHELQHLMNWANPQIADPDSPK